jgi:hypothetical protein
MDFIFGLIVGLAIGWNFLPQPEFVKNLIDRYFPSKN